MYSTEIEDTTESSSSAEASRSVDRRTQASQAGEERAQRRPRVRSDWVDSKLRRTTAEQVVPVEVICLDEDRNESDTITVAGSSVKTQSVRRLGEAAVHPPTMSTRDSSESIGSTEMPFTTPLVDTQSEEDLAALSGPLCPLCICPINSVYLPITKCTDCNRTYHTNCIGSGQPPQCHPFSNMNNAGTKQCSGCGCPDGGLLAVYCGCPSVLSHRRDQDPGFREYFRKGRMEEAKYDDFV